jgi:hypothetical protein
MQLTGADRSCDHLVNEHARDSATSTDTAPAGCGSNGVRSEFPDLLVIQETGRREDLVFASATALCRPGESESALRRRNTARISLVPPDGAATGKGQPTQFAEHSQPSAQSARTHSIRAAPAPAQGACNDGGLQTRQPSKRQSSLAAESMLLVGNLDHFATRPVRHVSGSLGRRR